MPIFTPLCSGIPTLGQDVFILAEEEKWNQWHNSQCARVVNHEETRRWFPPLSWRYIESYCRRETCYHPLSGPRHLTVTLIIAGNISSGKNICLRQLTAWLAGRGAAAYWQLRWDTDTDLAPSTLQLSGAPLIHLSSAAMASNPCFSSVFSHMLSCHGGFAATGRTSIKLCLCNDRWTWMDWIGNIKSRQMTLFVVNLSFMFEKVEF